MSIGTVGMIASFVVFGLIGWGVGRRGTRRAGPLSLVMLLVAAAVGSAVGGPGATLFGVMDFRMRLGHCIAAFFLGSFVGLLVRNRRLRGLRGAEAAAAVR